MSFKTPLAPKELTALTKIVPAGREEIVDAVFEAAPRCGIDPWLMLGFLHIESNFGKALTAGEYNGRKVWTGDFIPRPASGAIDTYLSARPLPGVKKVKWVRPKIGNLPAFAGLMWVPAHDLRVEKWGAKGAPLNNGAVPGGLGWGWTAFQLDWRWHPGAIDSGAMEDPAKAVEYAVAKIILPFISRAKKIGLKGESLIRAVVGAYNSGDRAIDAAVSGRDPSTTTAHQHYIDTVLSVAKSAGRTITI